MTEDKGFKSQTQIAAEIANHFPRTGAGLSLDISGW
jgi:hypothetical protein